MISLIQQPKLHPTLGRSANCLLPKRECRLKECSSGFLERSRTSGKVSSNEGSSETETSHSEDDQGGVPFWISAAGGLLSWAAFLGYSLILSPNQTPDRDIYFIQKALNYFPNDSFHLNEVFFSILYLFGIVSPLYIALMIPAGKSKNKIPAWPFLALSFLIGNFALLPYSALWQPDKSLTVPPTKDELQGWSKIGMRITESALFPVFLLLPSLWLVGNMISCGIQEWIDFFKLFEESRLVHVSTLDLTSLVLLLPFWMNNDATARKWNAKDQLLPVLSFIPIIGPVLYLILRPKAQR